MRFTLNNGSAIEANISDSYTAVVVALEKQRDAIGKAKKKSQDDLIAWEKSNKYSQVEKKYNGEIKLQKKQEGLETDRKKLMGEKKDLDTKIAAAQKAHADEFIRKLPKGYDTLVGERGIKLSGGERQRVAIARAMLKNAPILMLDEATSSLDSISETYIQEAFNELMKGKTTIVIAHRLSTIQKMDRIIVLNQGRIVESGTHQELLTKKGFYAELWEHQTGGFLE